MGPEPEKNEVPESAPAVGLSAVHSVVSLDFVEAVIELSSHFDGTWWSIDGIVKDPDLTRYQKQDTGYNLFPVEYIYQDGSGDYGFAGISFLPTGRNDGEFVKVSFSG